MTLDITPTILMVPGLRDHVAEHWQTLLERKLPKVASPAAGFAEWPMAEALIDELV